MNYVKHLNIYGIDADPIPCDVGYGPPTTRTVGAVGCLYMDIASKYRVVYKCTDVADRTYTWARLDDEAIALIDQMIKSLEDDIIERDDAIYKRILEMEKDLNNAHEPTSQVQIITWEEGD